MAGARGPHDAPPLPLTCASHPCSNSHPIPLIANHSTVRLISAEPANNAATKNISGPAPLCASACSAGDSCGAERTLSWAP
jgi:hypothetical protein